MLQEQKVLDIVKEIQAKHAAQARESGSDFNLLRMLGCSTLENSISAYLEYILRPGGLHGRGLEPLTYFVHHLPVKSLKPELADALRNPIPSPASSKLEYHIGYRSQEADVHQGGRIDILFQWPGVALLIENKPYAIDQEKQLGRYYQGFYKTHIPILLYLTKEGRQPSQSTLDSCPPDHVLSLSFREVFSILEGYAMTLPLNNHYRSSILQTTQYLSQALYPLAGNHMSLIQEIRESFRNKEQYEAAKAIKEAFDDFDHEQFRLLLSNIKSILMDAGCALDVTWTPFNGAWQGRQEDNLFLFKEWGRIGISLGFDEYDKAKSYISLTALGGYKDWGRERLAEYVLSLSKTNLRIVEDDSPWFHWVHLHKEVPNHPYQWDSSVIAEKLHTQAFADEIAQVMIRFYKAFDPHVRALAARYPS